MEEREHKAFSGSELIGRTGLHRERERAGDDKESDKKKQITDQKGLAVPEIRVVLMSSKNGPWVT